MGTWRKTRECVGNLCPGSQYDQWQSLPDLLVVAGLHYCGRNIKNSVQAVSSQVRFRANIFNRTKKAFLGQELSAFKWLIYAWTDILEDHLRKSIKLKPISSSANWEIGKCLWRVINLLIKKTSSYRFVLYQLSKNLNRPFFMEFLTKISVEYDRDFDKDEEPLLGGTVLIEAKYQVYCVNLWPKIF